MSDPYIQNLFADRIGGKAYGKGTNRPGAESWGHGNTLAAKGAAKAP